MEKISPVLRVSQVLADCKVSVAVVTCARDKDTVANELAAHYAENSTATITVVVADAEVADLDQSAVIIEQADVVIITLSNNFAVAKNGYQTLIFATRTLQKPFRYFNLMPTYVA